MLKQEKSRKEGQESLKEFERWKNDKPNFYILPQIVNCGNL